jgi:hypothetical protein
VRSPILGRFNVWGGMITVTTIYGRKSAEVGKLTARSPRKDHGARVGTGHEGLSPRNVRPRLDPSPRDRLLVSHAS